MTKQELLKDLADRGYVDAIVSEPEEHEIKPNGDKWYLVNIREVNGKAAIYRNIHFYVIGEGKASERAYYKDKEPELSIKSISAEAAI